MPNIECIQTPAAPTAIGPYSQAIKSGALVFLSGQIPLDPDTMALVEGGIDEHTRQVFRILSAIEELSSAPPFFSSAPVDIDPPAE